MDKIDKFMFFLAIFALLCALLLVEYSLLNIMMRYQYNSNVESLILNTSISSWTISMSYFILIKKFTKINKYNKGVKV